MLAPHPIDESIGSIMGQAITVSPGSRESESPFLGGYNCSTIKVQDAKDLQYFYEHEPFSIREVACAFRIPSPPVDDTHGLPTKRFRTAFADLPESQRKEKGGIVLFNNEHRGMIQPVYVDSNERMRHVFINLLLNAVKYSHESTDIKVDGLETAGSVARIAISNYGIGIPEGWEERIFDRDVRAPNMKEAGFTGAGVGLTIANTIVQGHGGRIYVEKNHDPTIFVVELPMI